MASAVIMMIGSLMLIPMIGAEFIPSMDQGQISVSIKMPNGTVLAETEKVAKQVEEIVNKVPEKDIVSTSIGSNVDGLLNDVLVLARYRDDNIVSERFLVLDELNGVLRLLEPEANRRGINLELRIAHGEWYVYGQRPGDKT